MTELLHHSETERVIKREGRKRVESEVAEKRKPNKDEGGRKADRSHGKNENEPEKNRGGYTGD